ncbi:MAG TPA: RES family NAD+ phosphorylase [Candidatus Limnocylindria bacterium]|nr:RES family NAD+ phosphorylase [Candidatus Limnocylindria bacterium]
MHRLSQPSTRFSTQLRRPGRFHPIHGPDGGPIPWLYGAEDDEGAICETILHDTPFVPGAIVSEAVLADRAISVIAPSRALRLALLEGLGLRRLGIERRDLIETGPTDYPQTALWAKALHDLDEARLDGLQWRARPNDTRRSLLLFADRVAEGDLEEVEAPLPLAIGAGYARVLRVTNTARVTLVPVD